MTDEPTEIEVWRRLAALRDLETVVDEFYELLGVDRKIKLKKSHPRPLHETTKSPDWH